MTDLTETSIPVCSNTIFLMFCEMDSAVLQTPPGSAQRLFPCLVRRIFPFLNIAARTSILCSCLSCSFIKSFRRSIPIPWKMCSLRRCVRGRFPVLPETVCRSRRSFVGRLPHLRRQTVGPLPWLLGIFDIRETTFCNHR